MSELEEILNQALDDIKSSESLNKLNDIRVKYLGKKSYITTRIQNLINLPKETKPVIGAIINKTKNEIEKQIALKKHALELKELNQKLKNSVIDISLPGRRKHNGSLHPITRTINRIKNFFNEVGFDIVHGLEIEDDYHNFDALNISKYHPSRNKKDTFWFNDKYLLRTQTSSIQIRIMKDKLPPIRIISPGRVYRNDYDKTHTPMFHQMEGLAVDKNICFANLKNILNDFLKNFFENDLKIRFRPSYFPFTEPSAEIDIMGKNGKWLEVLGCGMLHPNVLYNVGINSEVFSGFAFGMGIERLSMLRYGISDLRMFFENDIRFLKQFT